MLLFIHLRQGAFVRQVLTLLLRHNLNVKASLVLAIEMMFDTILRRSKDAGLDG
jgi:hypothetical protein